MPYSLCFIDNFIHQYIFIFLQFILFLGMDVLLVETVVVEYFFIIPAIIMLCLSYGHLLFQTIIFML